MASTLRTWSRESSGVMSMMRSIDLAALLVCSVPSTSTPVSAAESARFTVSMSRISPTTSTSGASRSAERSAAAKPLVCAPT